MIEFGHGTHAGLRRKGNEDTYYADPSTGVFLVVDGMGGPGRGEKAAALARDEVVKALRSECSVQEAIRAAACRIAGSDQAPTAGLPMGATLAILQLDGNDYRAAWVGDCPVLMHASGLQRLQVMPPTCETNPEEPDEPVREPGHGRALTQALGITAIDELLIQQTRGTLNAPVTFVLCSDGLTENTSLDALSQITARHELAAQELADHLLLHALDAGGHDNVTAIVVRVQPA